MKTGKKINALGCNQHPNAGQNTQQIRPSKSNEFFVDFIDCALSMDDIIIDLGLAVGWSIDCETNKLTMHRGRPNGRIG